MNRSKSDHLAFVLVCGLIFFTVAGVAAAQEPSFGLAPWSVEKEEALPRLDYSLEAGQSETSAVLVTNPRDEETYLRLFATDARTSTHGGVSFPDSSEPVSATGGWISLSASEFTLQPQEQRVIPFTISVPADARAGEHRAGILLELADPDTSRPEDFPEGQIYVAVRFRKALNVRVTVPGPVAVDFEIVSVEHVFEGGQSTFEVKLRNRGNISTDVAGGNLEVSDSSGQVIGSLPIRMSGKFLAGDTVVYVVLFDEPLPEGRYAVAVTMDYGGDAPATWQSTFEVVKEAAEEAEQEAIERGFKLSSGSAREGPNYWMYAAIGAGLIMITAIGVLIRILIGRKRQGREPEDR